MSSNRVTVSGDHHLVVEPAGFSKVWPFTRRLQFPLANVRAATFDPGVRDEPKGGEVVDAIHDAIGAR